MRLTPRAYALLSLPAIAGGLLIALTSPEVAVLMAAFAGLTLAGALIDRKTTTP